MPREFYANYRELTVNLLDAEASIGDFYANYQELNVFLGVCLRKNYENTKALRKKNGM